MKMVLLLPPLVLILSIGMPFSCAEIDPLSDEFINAINEKQSLWKAGRNFRDDISNSYIRGLLGWRRFDNNQPKPPQLRHNLVGVKIPTSFDWREHYPNCSSFRDIRDQGSCGSCWAFAAVEVISDRICIHSKGKLDISISADDLLSCCDISGGCGGGNPFNALSYWKEKGTVSGGPYGSNEGCRPYEISPCEHHINGSRPPCGEILPTPECKRVCQSGYSKRYENDLYFGQSSYMVPPVVKQIQVEIMKHGPVIAGFIVYDDFFHYKHGVYKHTKGDITGFHAVKILGWGVENSTPYWLVANSWNTDWGDKGYFKILRGENHCRIEQDIVAGIPA